MYTLELRSTICPQQRAGQNLYTHAAYGDGSPASIRKRIRHRSKLFTFTFTEAESRSCMPCQQCGTPRGVVTARGYAESLRR